MPERPGGLFLFDIDLTLIRSGGAGLRSLQAAFMELYEIPNVTQGYSPHGKLDRQIFEDLLAACGLKVTEQTIATVEVHYLENLAQQIKGHPAPELMPGVPDVLDFLEAQPGCDLALLTGNLRQGGMIKLSPFGLGRYFPIGAFASDHSERPALVRIARDQALEHYGRTYADREVYVIGDSPRDVDCAQKAGVVSVAVAAGDHDRATLGALGPDLLLDDLCNPQALLDGLMDLP